MPMSLGLSTSLANLIVSNTPISAYGSANRYIALHTANPTSSCLVGEIADNGYERTLIPLSILSLAGGKGLTNADVIVFPVGTGTIVGQITYGSIWDSQTGGNPISYGALTAPANWVEGTSLSLAVNAFIQLLRNTI